MCLLTHSPTPTWPQFKKPANGSVNFYWHRKEERLYKAPRTCVGEFKRRRNTTWQLSYDCRCQTNTTKVLIKYGLSNSYSSSGFGCRRIALWKYLLRHVWCFGKIIGLDWRSVSVDQKNRHVPANNPGAVPFKGGGAKPAHPSGANSPALSFSLPWPFSSLPLSSHPPLPLTAGADHQSSLEVREAVGSGVVRPQKHYQYLMYSITKTNFYCISCF